MMVAVTVVKFNTLAVNDSIVVLVVFAGDVDFGELVSGGSGVVETVTRADVVVIVTFVVVISLTKIKGENLVHCKRVTCGESEKMKMTNSQIFTFTTIFISPSEIISIIMITINTSTIMTSR